VTIEAAETTKNWKGSWLWREPAWASVEVMQPKAAAPATSPELEIAEQQAVATAALPPQPATATIVHTLIPPGSASSSRFHRSRGPEQAFRYLERFVDRFVRIRSTTHSNQILQRKDAAGSHMRSFPVGWHLEEVHFKMGSGDIVLNYALPLPQGLLVIRLRIDGTLKLVEWRSPHTIPSNLIDTVDSRAQFERAAMVLARNHGIGEIQPARSKPPKVEDHEPTPAVAQLPDDAMQLYEKHPNLPRLHWDGSWTHDSRPIAPEEGLRAIAEKLGVSIATAQVWRQQYLELIRQKKSEREDQIKAESAIARKLASDEANRRAEKFNPASQRGQNAEGAGKSAKSKRQQAQAPAPAPNIKVDKDLDYNRRTQGDNWY
jgi:hypothetical protein